VLDAEADYLVTVPAGVIFEGAGIGQTILDGENTYRVLKVLAGGSAKKLSITGAKAPGTAGSTLTGIAADVAGVLSDVDITGNDWTTGLDPECDVVVRAGGTLDGAEIHDLNHPNNTRGGIVYAYGTVKNTKVYRNSIQSAYPVFGVIGTTALAENCDIYGNTLRSREHSVGTAGILLQNGGTVRGCRIYSNTANPAAWYGYAGGIYINSGSGSLVEGCIVTNNVCGYHNNICNDFAGGIDAPAAATIRNTLVANNRVTGYFATGKYPVAGGIYLGNAGGVVENCTVVGNRVNGITDTTERGILSAKGTVRNTIVWDNALSNTAATVTYTCAAGLAAENGNLASDPKFRRGGYLLKSASPCRDSGTNLVWMAEATDLLSNPRIQADGVDMGCYEMPPAPGMLLLLK
jgi:hypothetical protein